MRGFPLPAGTGRLVPLLLCGLVAASSTFAVRAADAPATPAAKAAPRPAKPKPMSRDQLRACMDQQDRVAAMREQLLKEQASLDQQRNEVGRMDAALEQRRTGLDPADAEGAKALTEEEAKRNAVSEAFNARLPALRELNASFNQQRQSWVEQCADKDYDANDEAAIKRERQRAAKAAGSTK